jgi:hypothetical protein
MQYLSLENKICCQCKVLKSLEMFSLAPHHSDGRASSCKECNNKRQRENYKKPEVKSKILNKRKTPEYRKHRNEWRNQEHIAIKQRIASKEYRERPGVKEKLAHNVILKKYGLTRKEYDEIFSKQMGKCTICQRHQSELSCKLCVDHNHITGEIRGLLCRNCNLILGNSKESPTILSNCINYLNNFK